jgi:hypothetical protein
MSVIKEKRRLENSDDNAGASTTSLEKRIKVDDYYLIIDTASNDKDIVCSSSSNNNNNDLFSLAIGQRPVVEILVGDYGIHPGVLLQVTKAMSNCLCLRSLVKAMQPRYTADEWAHAIAARMFDRGMAGKRRELCDEFPFADPCIVLVPVHDSDVGYEFDIHVNVSKRADFVQLNHVDRDDGPESLDTQSGCECGYCRMRTVDEWLEECVQGEVNWIHPDVVFYLKKAMVFKDTPLADKFENNVEPLRGDVDRFARYQWTNGEYEAAFQFTANINSCTDVTPSDVTALLVHIFKAIGTPRSNTVRNKEMSQLLLCNAIRALVAQRTSGGIAFANRLAQRCVSTCIATINRLTRVDDCNEIVIDDPSVLKKNECDFNVALQHTRHHTVNHACVLGDLLCRAALNWRREAIGAGSLQ